MHQVFAVGDYVIPKGADPRSSIVFRIVKIYSGTNTHCSVERILEPHEGDEILHGYRGTWWENEIESIPEMILLARFADPKEMQVHPL